MLSNLTVLYDRMVSLPKCSLRMQLPMRQDLYPPAGVCLAIDRLDADHITTSPGDKIAARDWLSEALFEGSLPVQITEKTAEEELHPRGVRARSVPKADGSTVPTTDLLGIMTIDGSFQGKQLKILSSNNHKGQYQCDS